MREYITKGLGMGTHNLLPPDLIPQQAASDASNWLSKSGKIELVGGKLLVGAEESSNGYVKGLHYAFKADGTAQKWRKQDTKIQYYNASTLLWVDVITGLTASAEYTFSNYSSLAGAQLWITGLDGIYKIMTANPTSFCSMYDSTKNFKGKSIINDSRMIMWDLPNDKTGLYGSYIDAQDSTVYTSVTAEATTSLTGTLAFKAGDAKITCFGVQITITAGGEVYTDDYNGVLTGSLGGTGTINYTTGAYTLSNPGVGTANYQWEMSNAKGLSDFTKASPRQASQGFVFRQDKGGDGIQTVLEFDKKYYSIKKRSAYELDLTADDTNATNHLFRSDLGLQYFRGACATGLGIVFMDTANQDEPRLARLQKNLTGDALDLVYLVPHFDFSLYYWDACAIETFGETIILTARTKDSDENNRMFVVNPRRETVDVLLYHAKVMAKNAGEFMIGDSLSNNVYMLFSGFDDDEFEIANEWVSKDDDQGTELLKKTKRLGVLGQITPDQHIEVYESYDRDGFQLVGTIRGDGSYVDATESYTIGSGEVGEDEIGGGVDNTENYPHFFHELRVNSPKYRTRRIKFVAIGLGYCSIKIFKDTDIRTFPQRIPRKYRVKQNVSLDGTQTDQ